MRYQTEAVNRDGGTGAAGVAGGLTVKVSSPLDPDRDPTGTNPEQLLALAWSTCLNATAQAVVARQSRTSVRVEVSLNDDEASGGFEFHVDAYLSVEGASIGETQKVTDAAHARCPVSKLLKGAATVGVHAEAWGGVS